MPSDKYRIQGPSNAIDVSCLRKKVSKNSDEVENVTDSASYYINTGCLTQANGSAYVEYGNTKIICGVYGPLEIIRRDQIRMEGRLDVTFKAAPFSNFIRRECQPTAEDKRITEIIKEALEPVVVLSSFPKARYEVHLVVLQDDNDTALSACVTCAGLALVNAGVDMHDLVIGVHHEKSGLSLATMPNLGQVTMLVSTNKEISLEDFKTYINESVSHCKSTLDVITHHLKAQLINEETKKKSIDSKMDILS